MDATATLIRDHRLIERVLRCLEAAAQRIERKESFRIEAFIDAADVIACFADGCHHRKEEEMLFPALVRAGLTRDSGPLGVMLFEHDDGRRYAAAMRLAARRVMAGESHVAREVAEDARAYAALMRQHMLKEERFLFPLAERLLNEEEREAVLGGCAAIDRNLQGQRVDAEASVDALEAELACAGQDAVGVAVSP
jgi:hemerythrin-like domain-containing protein